MNNKRLLRVTYYKILSTLSENTAKSLVNNSVKKNNKIKKNNNNKVKNYSLQNNPSNFCVHY